MNTNFNSMDSLVCKLLVAVVMSSLSLIAFAKANLIDAHQHIHKAQLVNPSDTNLILNNNGSSTYTLQLVDKSLEFELFENKALMEIMASGIRSSDEIIYFTGNIKGNDASWARLTYQSNQVTGAYYDGNSLYLIEAYKNVASALQHRALQGHLSQLSKKNEYSTVVVDIQDVDSTKTCALHDHSDQSLLQVRSYDSFVQNLKVGFATVAREIKINLVADTNFVSSSNNATAEMLSHLNVADGIFSNQLNINIVADEVIELADNGDLTSTDAQQLLFAFRDSNIANPGVKHLFTGRNLDGSTAGIAYVGALCNRFAVGLTQRVGALTSLVFTHELGHNFGAPHDNQSGSACSSTPSGFVMNPNVSSGGREFSACSIENIQTVIEATAQRFSACLVEKVSQAPEITSTPNTSGKVNIAYLYDADGFLDLEGTAPFEFNLDIAPDGMSIDQDGKVTWMPQPSDIGTVPVQITVSNSMGHDTQFFEISVSEDDTSNDFINFNEYPINSHDLSQDKTGGAYVGDTAYTLVLEGNTWKSIPFNYTVTENTVLEFEFKSSGQAEIQGIGFGNENKINSQLSFSVYGTQTWGITDHRYLNAPNTQTFTIAVGEYIEGNYDRLVFFNDNDANKQGTNTVISNVKIYELQNTPSPREDEPAPLNLGQMNIASITGQDGNGTVTIVENGLGIELEGNKWEIFTVMDIEVQPSTVIEFEFKSTAQGEIQGLGFFNGTEINSNRAFKLLGTQEWGITDFEYTQFGQYQRFAIPVGRYFTQTSLSMTFIMDHDVSNPTGNAIFRNIVVKN
ncbi:M12 family metallo-peptidase [Agaribacter flavus]|uniref:M12 family metallo-peptidase n=1 Tax=Agaribacter flavus TaxID=1902781 RepID=A0ABV7FPC7_9ALTE